MWVSTLMYQSGRFDTFYQLKTGSSVRPCLQALKARFCLDTEAEFTLLLEECFQESKLDLQFSYLRTITLNQVFAKWHQTTFGSNVFIALGSTETPKAFNGSFCLKTTFLVSCVCASFPQVIAIDIKQPTCTLSGCQPLPKHLLSNFQPLPEAFTCSIIHIQRGTVTPHHQYFR